MEQSIKQVLNKARMNNLLEDYRIKAECIDYWEKSGTSNLECFDLKLKTGCKIKDITAISSEIAVLFNKTTIPLIKPILNEGIIRVEFQYKSNNKLNLIDIIYNSKIPKFSLPILLGKDSDSNPLWIDLVSSPHMIVGGATGSGKSVLLHNLIFNLLNFSSEVWIYLIDPKNSEFNGYEKVSKKFFIVNEKVEVEYMLAELLMIMETRYLLLKKDPNAQFPYIVLMIDEYSDIFHKNHELRDKLIILAQKCRAAKIHIVLVTQHPSAKLLDSHLRANFPTRIACRTASAIESRIILDAKGAEQLYGNGDAIYKNNYGSTFRCQIAYTSKDEIISLFKTTL